LASRSGLGVCSRTRKMHGHFRGGSLLDLFRAWLISHGFLASPHRPGRIHPHRRGVSPLRPPIGLVKGTVIGQSAARWGYTQVLKSPAVGIIYRVSEINQRYERVDAG